MPVQLDVTSSWNGGPGTTPAQLVSAYADSFIVLDLDGPAHANSLPRGVPRLVLLVAAIGCALIVTAECGAGLL
jgi:hypothetical protein